MMMKILGMRNFTGALGDGLNKLNKGTITNY